MATISKRELTDRIAEGLGHTKSVTSGVVQAFLDEVIDELTKGNRLEFREFGVFELNKRAARNARIPQNGDAVVIPARVVVKFKAGRTMKAALSSDQETVGLRSGSQMGSADD